MYSYCGHLYFCGHHVQKFKNKLLLTNYYVVIKLTHQPIVIWLSQKKHTFRNCLSRPVIRQQLALENIFRTHYKHTASSLLDFREFLFLIFVNRKIITILVLPKKLMPSHSTLTSAHEEQASFESVGKSKGPNVNSNEI